MRWSRRPNKHSEREQCIDAVAHFEGMADLDPAIESIFRHKFVPARDDYLAADTGYSAAMATTKAARRALAKADKVHDAKFRTWVGTVRSEDGTPVPQELAQIPGVLPGRYVELSPRDEVSRARRLFERLEKLPHLAGDETRLTEFYVAYEELAARVADDEQAERARPKAHKALTRAAKTFDSAWGLLVRTILQTGGPEQTLCQLPLFPRPEHPEEGEESASLAEPEDREEDGQDEEPAVEPPVQPPRPVVAVTSPPQSE